MDYDFADRNDLINWVDELKAENQRLKEKLKVLVEAAEMGLQPNALICLFHPQAADPHKCCCGKP